MINGLRNKIFTLRDYLEKYSIDILLLQSINNNQDIDNRVQFLTESILNAHANNSKPIPINKSKYIPHFIRLLIRKKNKLKRAWQFHRDPATKIELNRAQVIVRREISKFKQGSWANHHRSLQTEDNSLFGTAASIKKKFKPIPQLHNPDKTIAITDEEKSETIANSL